MARPNKEIPLYTLEGVKDADVSTHYFNTDDGLGLSMLRFNRGACDDAVLIIHGLTTSTDMFIMPEHRNLVTFLIEEGLTDVWTLDFRMSNRHPYNLWRHRMSLDDCALYDFPKAIETMRQHIGDRRIHVICHCLGSCSFMMSLYGGAVEGIHSVAANSVALTPRVPRWSRAKLAIAPFAVEYLLNLPYLSPRFSQEPALSVPRTLSRVVSLFHRECNVPDCHMLSLMWGTGWPALYEHQNLHEVTHRRGGDLYGGTGMNYYRHVRKMVKAGRAVKYRHDAKYASLPEDYLANAQRIETPVLFMTGRNNRVFSDSNIECFRRIDAVKPNLHDLEIFEGYGHQDPFMGKDSDKEVFPKILTWIDRHRRGYGLSATNLQASSAIAGAGGL